ncbi:hypothetical protein M0812_21999 [Anaeramoeba flamelloides]|uniref:B-block binding subunit of TFIIIC domain-containing protein n=1 Tax=Anaeramoeba flamelloides TaxID=1746091 RepID=A0AAV7YU78_9EUKA|nr:hypothetical protein M0812_21999 [Anaeramoeba flamelloides]
MDFIQDKENTTTNVDFIGLHFAFAIYLYDKYEDDAFINAQKIQEDFKATLPLWITKRLKNELSDLVQIFIQTHLLSNDKSTKNEQILQLNKSWRPIVGSIKYRNKIKSFGDLSQQEQKEIQQLKKSSALRQSKTISMLSVLVLNELRNGIISRDLISQNTGFARQRICTVLSVFKSLGIVKETGTRRKLRVILNEKKLGNISNIYEQTKTIRNLREEKKKLLEKVKKLLNQLEKIYKNQSNFLKADIQKDIFNKIHIQLNKKMNNKLKIKKQSKKITKIQIPNLKKRNRFRELTPNSLNTTTNKGQSKSQHKNKNKEKNMDNHNNKKQTMTQLQPNIMDLNTKKTLLREGPLIKKELPNLNEKARRENFKRKDSTDQFKSHQAKIIHEKNKKQFRKVKIIVKKRKRKQKRNINNINKNGNNKSDGGSPIKLENKLINNGIIAKNIHKKQITKPILKISTKVIRETFNPNFIPTQISPIIRDDKMNMRLSSPLFETDFTKGKNNSSQNLEDNFDFQSSFPPFASSISPTINSKNTYLPTNQSENTLSPTITPFSISISNDPLFSFPNSPIGSNGIINNTHSPYFLLNSPPPLLSPLKKSQQKNFSNQSNFFQSQKKQNTLLSPRLSNNLRSQKIKNDNSHFKTPYFINKPLPDLKKLIGSD